VIPDDQPAVSVSKVDVRANARHWVFEAMPVSVCPSVGDDIRLYTFLGFEDATASTNVNKATKPPKWVQLHEHAASTAADENLVLYGAPPCSKFRLRVLDAVGTTPSNKVAFDLQIQVRLLRGLRLLAARRPREVEQRPSSSKQRSSLQSLLCQSQISGWAAPGHPPHLFLA